MEWLWQWLDKIRTFLTTKFDLGQPDFWGAMFSWVLIGILAFIGLRIYKGTLSGFFFLQRRVVLIPRALRAYQRKLEEATLTIRHSWKLEGQDFRQLLVPVNFETAGSGIRMGIGTFLAQHFGPGLCPRFVLTGEPGSGKSVAMGSIARQVWFLVRNPALVPVLLTFSDIKHVRTQEEMEEAVVKSLQKYQFEKGKRTRRACHYAQTKFYSGDILVLLDGFDELEKSARQQTARFLEAFFSTYPQIPFVISCRTAVWKDSPGVFAMLHPEVVSMVRFNNNDIRQFLSAWQFQGNKSSEQLGELIRTKPYLQTIAENPLMLTIIAYLYAQPKRILPDNRVKFYQECVDALMEEFDNTKQIERANEFQTIDKVTILSHIAYRHIVGAETTDTEIRREMVLDTIRAVMEKLSRPVEKRQKMLTEIVQNTELLVELPPDHYKFPHRTFMEYFAANYFVEENKAEELLRLYAGDKGKWQETLALFCGMNLRDEIAQTCLTALDGHFVETQDAARPDVFVYRALVESAKVQPQWALPLLDRAGRFLESKFDYELVECLGYIAANPNLTYAPEAAAILTKKLEARLSNAEITALLMALSANREGKTGELIAKYLDKITPNGLYELLRYDMRSVVSIIQQFNRAKLDGFIKTVEGKGDITMLLNIFRYAAQEEVKCNCAVALANLSKNKSFYNTLDASGEVTLSKAEEATYALFQDWSWEKYRPFGENGKKMLALLVHYLVWGYERGGVEFRNRIKTGNMANFLRFHFGTALSSKRMLNRFDDRLLANIPVKNLKSAWQRRNLIQFEGVCVIITLLAMVLVSPFFIYPSGYGKLLILFSILGLSFLILSDKVFKKDTPLGTSVAFLLFSYFSILEDFSNKWVDFVLGCLFAAMHTFFILDTNLSNPVKTLYLLFFYVLFISFNFLGKGLLYFILPPERLRDRLKDDEVKPQDPIPPTERYTDSGDYTYAMSA